MHDSIRTELAAARDDVRGAIAQLQQTLAGLEARERRLTALLDAPPPQARPAVVIPLNLGLTFSRPLSDDERMRVRQWDKGGRQGPCPVSGVEVATTARLNR